VYASEACAYPSAGGRSNIIPGIIVGSAVGYLQTRFIEQRNITTTDTAPMGIGQWIADSRLNPMQKLSDEQYKAMLLEKQVRAEAEIAMLDEQIAKLKADDQSASQNAT